MPTLAINDLVVHRRDNDLVLGTHGRGVWILDALSPIQELAAAMASGAAGRRVLAAKHHVAHVRLEIGVANLLGPAPA